MAEWKLVKSKAFFGTVETFKMQPALLTDPIPNQEAYLGWLSPLGILYGCDYGDHNKLQAELEHFFVIRSITRDGWIGLNYSVAHTGPEWDWPEKITEAQEKAITDWCYLYEFRLPEFLIDHSKDDYYVLNVPIF